MSEQLQGEIERVTFHNPDNGFCVLKVRVKGEAEPVPVLGKLTMVKAGEHLEASGKWVMNPEHGRQFQADEIRTRQPTSPEGLRHYLASGVIKGVGPKLADRIVDLYGEKTLHILDNYPEMLASIPGIGRQTVKKIRTSWQEQKWVREIMIFLQTYGIGSARAVRIFRTYGEQSIEIIRENPYQLAEDIRGIGFQTADELARKMGLPGNSPYRANAGVVHVVQQGTSQGHCGLPERTIIEETARLLEVEEHLVEAAVETQVAAEKLTRERINGDQWLFLPRLHEAEISIAASLKRLLDEPDHPLPRLNLDQAIDTVEAGLSFELAEAQRAALKLACEQKCTVITGGPGVGKTTLVKSLLEIFEGQGLRCVLAAPTGRAAKRLAETTGREARTVHRLLQFDPFTLGFQQNEENPLEGDLFVLDETSMVDAPLCASYLRAIPPTACVVLVGDIDQLPSVGPGQVLGDVIHSGQVPVIRLTRIFRQASESQIISAAWAIREGELPDLTPPKSGLADFYFTECEDSDAIESMVVKLVQERIPVRFGMDPMTDIQVLTPMNRTQLGARHLNEVLQQSLNPPSPSLTDLQRFGWTYRVGDRVIQTENNYQREVYNGDLGIIRKIDGIDQELQVDFDGRLVNYDFGALDELALAYVLTIHKSQGSEYPCVVIPLHTQHFLLLQRNLLYTAITRGRKLVVVVGSRSALETAIARADTSQRHTVLQKRLRDAFAG